MGDHPDLAVAGEGDDSGGPDATPVDAAHRAEPKSARMGRGPELCAASMSIDLP